MQLPTRLLIIVGSMLAVTAFALGILHWETNPYACFNGRNFYGEWVTIFNVGKLEIRTRPWGCNTASRYDPSKWQSLSKYQP